MCDNYWHHLGLLRKNVPNDLANTIEFRHFTLPYNENPEVMCGFEDLVCDIGSRIPT